VTGSCSAESRARDEPLAGTGPRAERWLLVEHRGAWAREPLGHGLFPDPVEERLHAEADSPETKLLLIRRPDRRSGPLAVFVARSSERGSTLAGLELGSHEELAHADLAAARPVETPLILVCTHGKRDACCARRGRPVWAQLSGRFPYVWQSSHLGGHRFSPNVAILPDGLTFGRVDPDEATALVESYRAGVIALERLRGRSINPPAVQAAEHAVRVREGLTGVADLELAGLRSDGDGTHVRFREVATGALHELKVHEEAGEPTPASCGEEPSPTTRFRL
jgi:hypothetical protein